MTATISPLVRFGARDAQRTFRAVLDALSRPGTTVGLPVPDGLPTALGPLLALADLDTPMCLLGGDRWLDAVATATSAPVVAPERARLVAALRPVTAAELRGLRTGSPSAPEDAALVTLAVPALTGGPTVGLTGPGARPGAVLTATGLPPGWLDARAAATFPAGVDLLLVDPDGRCVGLPRSIRMGD